MSIIENLCYTESEVLHELERQRELSAEIPFPEGKDRCNNPHERAIGRLHALLVFIREGVTWEHGSNGLIKVYPKKGGAIFYSLRTGAWKHRKSRSKYWRAKIKPENFIKRYVYGPEF